MRATACVRPITRIIMHRYLRFALGFAALAVPVAHAQERTAAPPTAANAEARVPQTKYDSAFTGYQPYREQKLAPWRELNDEVHKAGGHIGIFGATPTQKPAPASGQHPPEHKK
jgi:hypothetical protein